GHHNPSAATVQAVLEAEPARDGYSPVRGRSALRLQLSVRAWAEYGPTTANAPAAEQPPVWLREWRSSRRFAGDGAMGCALVSNRRHCAQRPHPNASLARLEKNKKGRLPSKRFHDY